MTMPERPYELRYPSRLTSCVVFSSPHSGRHYPGDLVAGTRLNPVQLRQSEDAYVEALFAAAPSLGAPLIAATVPRAYIDLNRSPGELDPALIEGVRPQGLNPRVAAGLGVVPRVVAEGVPIYVGKITMADAQRRVERYHAPYHDRLVALIEAARASFGLAILFDCHSMPSDALRAQTQAGGRRPDVVLGDRYGASASGWVVDRTQAAFEAAGFQVARNTPFAGGYITQRYGRPGRAVHAVQIELDRGLYLNEARIEPGAGYETTLAALSDVVAALVQMGQDQVRHAAE